MLKEEFLELVKKIEKGVFTDPELKLFISSLDENYDEEVLHDDEVILLAKALKHNPDVTRVNLAGNRGHELSAIALADVSTLEELNLSENSIGLRGIVGVAACNHKHKFQQSMTHFG